MSWDSVRRAALGRPGVAAFAVALTVRVAVAVAVAIGWNGSLFLDDATYSRMAEAASNGTLEQIGGSYWVWLYERTGVLLVPITGLYEVFGPVQLAGQLYVALLGALTAGLTARLAREVTTPPWALAAGLIVALLPSQILWSSLILKDAAVWALLAGIGVAAALAGRATGRALVWLVILIVGQLVLLAYLRLHTMEVAAVALVVAAAVSQREWRMRRTATMVVVLIVLPLPFSMGPAGITYLEASPNLGSQRAANAEFAATAVGADVSDRRGIGDAPSIATGSGDDGVERRGIEPSPEVPYDGVGRPTTRTDERQDDVADSALDHLAYLPRGLAVVLLRPWPWEAAHSTGLRLAQFETAIWYPILLLAAIGVTALRPNARTLAFPLVAGLGIVLMYALTEGNLGTAYRHRGELVWVVAVLAALGAQRVAATVRARRSYPPIT